VSLSCVLINSDYNYDANNDDQRDCACSPREHPVL